jgi:predicted phosphodiesterase
MLPVQNDLKHRHTLSSTFFNFPLEYAIRRSRVNQDGLKLNCTHQLLVYADDVNISERSIYTIKKNRGLFAIQRSFDIVIYGVMHKLYGV